MLDKLKETEKKYITLEEQIASPDALSDMERYTKLMKEYKSLTPLIEKDREYVRT